MNSCNSKTNFLLINDNQESIKTFYKTCLQFIKEGKIVLLLTGSTKDLLPILKEEKLNETELKRFVVINLDTLDECIDKLCEQHDWTWLPSLIIVDLRTLLSCTASEYLAQIAQDLNTTEVNPPNYFQLLALCIANVLDYKQSVLKRIEKHSTSSSNVLKSVFSIIILNEHSPNLTREQIDLLINLYFYKNNAFDNVDEIMAEISSKNQ